jgi:hypothetical protein
MLPTIWPGGILSPRVKTRVMRDAENHLRRRSAGGIPTGPPARSNGRFEMPRQLIATIFATLTLLAPALGGCATMSDEEHCRKEGGVWHDKMCERQAK